MIQYSQINIIHHIKKMKDKKHKVISVDAEKAFKKNSTSISDKNSTKQLQTEDTHIINVIYDKIIKIMFYKNNLNSVLKNSKVIIA